MTPTAHLTAFPCVPERARPWRKPVQPPGKGTRPPAMMAFLGDATPPSTQGSRLPGSSASRSKGRGSACMAAPCPRSHDLIMTFVILESDALKPYPRLSASTLLVDT